MFEHIGEEHRRIGALVDTNLFLLLLVGRYDVAKLPVFRATQKYSQKTYQLLEILISHFSRLYTTPSIVTEVDNLSRQVAKGERAAISKVLERVLSAADEELFSSLPLVRHQLHEQIGIADCSAFEMSGRDILIITDDFPLTVVLERNGRPVINLSRYLLDLP